MTTLLDPKTESEYELQEKTSVLVTNRYDLEGLIGKGCWGDVFKARDKATGEEVALKILNPSEIAQQQMQDNELTPFAAIANESGLESCSNVISSSYEIDEVGTPFIKMHYYPETLADKIEPSGNKLSLDNGLTLETIIGYLSGVATGLFEMHTIRKKIHRDIKPDNILIDKTGKPIISDLGTATCEKFGWLNKKSGKANRGHIYTRSPEGFTTAEPQPSNDVYSFGSLAYRMFTGKYILEEEIDNSVDPTKFFEQIGQEGVQKIINKKIKKNIPRKWRKFFRKCLDTSPYSRYSNGEELVKGLEETVENLSSWNWFKNNLIKPLIYTTVSVGILSYMAYKVETHEPQVLSIPKVGVNGLLYPEELTKTQDKIDFAEEDITDLPRVMSDANHMSDGLKNAKAATDNRVVAYLLNTHWQAYVTLSGIGGPQMYSDNQHSDYMSWKRSNGVDGTYSDSAYPGGAWNIWAKSIETALNRAKIDGKVDLEDVCSISRVGTNLVNEAKNISKSVDYKNYRTAKRSDGSYVIPEKEQGMINQWLSYIHNDVN